jgi:hypothetical protein
MRKRWPRSLPLIATLALVLLAGCGGGSDEPPQPPAEPVAWFKTFALGEGRSVVETPTGVLAGYLVVGTVNDAALATKGSDAYVLSTDTKGALLGAKAIGGTGNDTGRVVRRTQDGGYVMLGEFMMGSNRQLWAVKMDARGNDEWSRFYGYSTRQEFAADIVEIPGVGYLLAGTTAETDLLGINPSQDVFLVRTILNGDVLWADRKGYDDSFEIAAAAVQVTSDGGAVFVGSTTQFDANGDIWLVKVAGNGQTLWHRHFGTADRDVAASVRVTADGGFIIAGTTGREQDRQIYLLKTDAQGIQQWSRTLGGAGSETCAAMELTRDGGFILAGSTTSRGAGGADGYLVKTDAQGNVLWENTFGSTGDDHFYAVQATSDGGYVMTGSTAREGATYVYLVKTDANGSSLP